MKKNIDINSLLKKIKEIDFKTVINFIGDNRRKIEGIIYLSLTVLFLILSIFYSFKAINKYKEVEEKIKTIEIIKDNKIKNFVSINKLRNLDTITNTLCLLENKTCDEKTINRIKQYVYKTLLLYKFKNSDNDLSENSISYYFFYTGDLLKLDDKTKLEILQNIDDKQKLKSILHNNKLALLLFKNGKKYAKSDDFKSFINKFPNIGTKKGNKTYNNLAKVLKNLYLYEYLFINNSVKSYKDFLNEKKQEYEAPYKYFLSYIYLPPINIWSDKYSDKIHVDLFGEDYLKKAKYIDMNLMAYWGNFFSKTYNGELYGKNGKSNKIQNINIGKFTPVDDKIAKLPINVEFLLEQDKMFYALISKLTSTSDKKNVLLIDEFTYHLWKNIYKKIKYIFKNNSNEKKGYVYLKYLLDTCSKDFGSCEKMLNCKKNCNKSDILDIIEVLHSTGNNIDISKVSSKIKQGLYEKIGNDFKKSTIYKYIDNQYYNIDNVNQIIGARLYNCIFENGYCDDILGSNGKIIANSIEDFASCKRGTILKCMSSNGYKKEDCNTCRINFIKKFDTNYFIPYTLVGYLDKNYYTLNDRLKDVYKNIPDLLELNSFVFSQNDEGYNSKIGINVYYKYLSNEDLAKILSYIGTRKCPNITNKGSWSINIALSYINKKINNLYKGNNNNADFEYSLKEKKKILENLNKKYNGAKNIDKLIYALQAYRIFKENNYCIEQ